MYALQNTIKVIHFQTANSAHLNVMNVSIRVIIAYNVWVIELCPNVIVLTDIMMMKSINYARYVHHNVQAAKV